MPRRIAERGGRASPRRSTVGTAATCSHQARTPSWTTRSTCCERGRTEEHMPEPLLRTAPRPLADPAPPEIITPPQYSSAWVILAVLCVLVIIVLVVATLKSTRAVEKRIAYRRRPDDVEALKAEFLRTVND